MTAIVMNTLTGAVSEYDWTFRSLTPQFAGGATLAALGGDDDAGAPIAASMLGGTPGGAQVQVLGEAFLAVRGEGTGVFVVQGRTQSWEYPLVARSSGVSRAKPGQGIRESYLGFGYRNVAGSAFTIDRIDVEVFASNNRRK